MKLPGFAAESSVYRTNNHYRLAAGATYLSEGNATIVPQDCGVLQGIECGAFIAAGAVFCTADCLAGAAAGPAGGFPCWACWTAFLGGATAACWDCIPAWMKALIDEFESGGGSGGGGGAFGGGAGGGQCGCPVGEKCCGNCVKKGGLRMCDGLCVRRNQQCP